MCFSCSELGDIFDLVGYIEGLEDDFIKRYNRTYKIMKPYLGKSEMKHSSSGVSDNIPVVIQPEMDYAPYLEECHANVHKTLYFKKRGLSKETIDRFKLGYDEKKKIITIPYNPDCKGYVHRITWKSDNKYCKFGNEIFNLDALYNDESGYVLVTEGQIDAMSFIEIGRPAIGLGGVNEITRLVKQLKDHPSKKTLILALDNDKAGRRATGKLIEELTEAEINQNVIVNFTMYGEYKDANDFLVADRSEFIHRIKYSVPSII